MARSHLLAPSLPSECLTLERSSLRILMPSAFVPDGLFAVVLSLRLFERPLLAAGDY